jgi:hypothetical protein
MPRALLRVQRHVESITKDLKERLGVRDVAQGVDDLQGFGLSEPVVELPQRIEEERFHQRFAHPAGPKPHHLLPLQSAPAVAGKVGDNLLMDWGFGTDHGSALASSRVTSRTRQSPERRTSTSVDRSCRSRSWA